MLTASFLCSLIDLISRENTHWVIAEEHTHHQDRGSASVLFKWDS